MEDGCAVQLSELLLAWEDTALCDNIVPSSHTAPNVSSPRSTRPLCAQRSGVDQRGHRTRRTQPLHSAASSN